MTSHFIMALAQVSAAPDYNQNFAKAERFAHQAVQAGADWLVFPEMFMALPTPEQRPTEIVANDGGRFVANMQALAKASAIYITFGGWEACDAAEKAYNTAYTLSPQGKILADYRKLHLFDALKIHESDTMLAGSARPPLLIVKGVKVGFAICYDLRFPELFRDLAQRGAEVVVVPSAWYEGPMKAIHWETLLRARAIENNCYVAGCNLVQGAFCGQSAIIDPFGVTMAAAGEAETLIAGRCDAERVREVRANLPSLAHQRSDLYPDTL
jgi:predicted amidohydrolase